VTSSTVSELSLLETLEQTLKADVSVSLLAEIERELLRLRCELSASDWDTLCDEFPDTPLFEILRLGTVTSKRLTGREFKLPSALLEMITANAFQARPSLLLSAAHTIGAWEYSLPVSRSMRARKTYFAHEIAETLRISVKPRILILGGSPWLEASDALQASHLHHAEFIALEPELHSHHQLRVETGNWSDLARLGPSLGFFDLIYSSTWLDSTGDSEAACWLDAAVDLLRSGGRLLAANFAPGSRDVGWSEACWNWRPCYRSEEDLAHLLVNLKNPGIRGHAISRDESGASAFIEIHSI
jgi:hypothetical protein